MKTYADGIRDAIELVKTLDKNSPEYIVDRLRDYESAFEQGHPRKVPRLTKRQERMLSDFEKHFTLDAITKAYDIKENPGDSRNEEQN